MELNSGDVIKVMIVDDHSILRSGLKLLIDAQPGMRVVGEASSTSEIEPVLNRITADVLLLDIGMPGGSGLRALRRLRMSFPATRVVILTMHDDVALARSALAAGVSGFVLKQTAHAELLSAIRAAHKGGLFIDPSLVRALLTELVKSGKSPVSVKRGKPLVTNLLSDRERQVLRFLAQGYSNQEIATRIYVSIKTVETYRARIADKLGLRTRPEITRYALVTGLLTVEDALDERGVA